MLDRLFSSQLSHMERGLSLASKRQEVLADNLACANVPGYKRRDVDFAVALDEEIGGIANVSLPGAGGGSEVEYEDSVRVDDSSVDPEKEAIGIAQTELRFQTIADLTAGYFSGLKNAIREGR